MLFIGADAIGAFINCGSVAMSAGAAASAAALRARVRLTI